MLGARRIMVSANGLEFEVFEAGEGDRLAMLLHGFPQHAIEWRHVVAPLVAKGYRVWAVNQRGYGDSARPAERSAYSLEALTGDIVGLIDAAGAKSVSLVSHDWGGFIAWTVAVRKLRPIEQLVFVNIPHPLCYKRALKNWRQLLRATYVFLFQIPGPAEWLLTHNSGSWTANLMRRAVHRSNPMPEAAVEIYRENVCRPGAARAMLNWYRVAAVDLYKAADLAALVEVPTLMIWGTNDPALDLGCLEGTEQYVQDLRIERLPKVTHWAPEDAPDKVVALIESFL